MQIKKLPLATIYILCCLALFISTLIRISLASQDAKRVVATDVITFGTEEVAIDPQFYRENSREVQNDAGTEEQEQIVQISYPEGISAKAYIVANLETGEIYTRRNASTPLPVASMSKLVTAFAATDQYSDSTKISLTEQSMNVPLNSDLKEGEKFALRDLLYPLLLNSSNAAAEAISLNDDRDRFMELMSSYAWEIGMPNSYFADPSGLSSKNVASAGDLVALAEYLLTYRKDILEITRNKTRDVSTTTDHDSHVFVSTHPFVDDPRFIGGKTGRTPEAGETMMTILEIDEQPIAFIVLGSVNRAGDTRKLIEKVVN